MLTKSTNIAKRVTLAVFVAIAVVYAIEFFGSYAVAMRNRAVAGANLAFVYDEICAFRVRNGRFPQELEEAVGQQGAALGLAHIFDPVCHRHLRYHPNVTFGSKAIILAQSEPTIAGIWPFVTKKRLGIQADRKLVDLYGDDSEVDGAQ